jgi:hypothetical protein
MSLGFIFFGLSEILLGYTIYRNSKKFNHHSLLIVLAGTGVFMATVFSMDINGKPTLAGNLHFIGAIVQFILFPVFCLSAYKNPLTAILNKWSAFVGISSLFMFILMAVAIYLKDDMLFSITEKVDILIFTVWLMIMELSYL